MCSLRYLRDFEFAFCGLGGFEPTGVLSDVVASPAFIVPQTTSAVHIVDAVVVVAAFVVAGFCCGGCRDFPNRSVATPRAELLATTASESPGSAFMTLWDVKHSESTSR